MSPDQGQEEQRRVVWSRLHNHRANLAKRLTTTRERYLAARRDLNPQMTQVESSHDPLYRDIKSNLTTASRAEKVFQTGVPLNRRGECNVPKKYLKSAEYTSDGDDPGYFVYHDGTFIPAEFDFTHCFWYIVKYNDQQSCWLTHKLPKQEYSLEILDSEVTDRSEWGPIDDGKYDSDQSDQEDAKSEVHPESIDIKIPTEEEERSERQLEKLADLIPTLSRPRSHTATSRLPPITTVMATQTTTEPTQTFNPEEGPSSVRKGGGPPGDDLDPAWFGGSAYPHRAPRGGGGGGDGGGDGGGGGAPPAAAGRGNTDDRGNGTKLSGKEPAIFNGDRSKAEAFLLEWTIYRMLNGEQDIMRQAFSRVMLFLTDTRRRLVAGLDLSLLFLA